METTMVHWFRDLPVEWGFVLLSGSVFLLLIVMVLYFRRMTELLRRSGPLEKRSDDLRQWVEESERIYEKLSQALEERKEIASRLIAQLDARIEALRSMMAEVDRGEIPVAEEVASKKSEEEVLEMVEEGKEVSEIARQTGLSIGAVQFIMNLKRWQESSPSKTPLIP